MGKVHLGSKMLEIAELKTSINNVSIVYNLWCIYQILKITNILDTSSIMTSIDFKMARKINLVAADFLEIFKNTQLENIYCSFRKKYYHGISTPK